MLGSSSGYPEASLFSAPSPLKGAGMMDEGVMSPAATRLAVYGHTSVASDIAGTSARDQELNRYPLKLIQVERTSAPAPLFLSGFTNCDNGNKKS